MPMSPQAMAEAVIRNLPAKTGKTLAQWVELVKREGPADRKARVAWLKEVHKLGHVQASVVVEEAERPAGYVPPTPEALVDAQYSGPKAALRPIYEALLEAVAALGPEAVVDPRQTYVTLRRRRQFAVIQPTTRTRVDLFLVLPGVAYGGRLQPSGKEADDRLTHKVALTAPSQVDDEVRAWLAAAFAQDVQ